MQKKYQPRRKEQGQSMIELALTITFLMVLLAGTIDLGHAFFVWLAMRDAAQEGATYGSYDPSVTVSQISDYVESLVRQDAVKDPGADINVFPTFSGDRCLGYHPDPHSASLNKPNTITVLVEYINFPITTPLLGAIIGDTITIRATISDSILAPACGGH